MTKKLEPGDFVTSRGTVAIVATDITNRPYTFDHKQSSRLVLLRRVEDPLKDVELKAWKRYFESDGFCSPVWIVLTNSGEIGWEWENSLERIDCD